MAYENLRKEVSAFYQDGNFRNEPVKAFAEKCFAEMDRRVTEDMSVTAQVMLQEQVITELFEPKIFRTLPFYCEMGALNSISDGAWWAKGGRFPQAGGWVYRRNQQIFVEQDPELHARRHAQGSEILYLICGEYNDSVQHFNFNSRPFLEGGLISLYKKAEELLPTAKDTEEEEFLRSVMNSMLCIKRIAEKFAEKAAEMLETETDEEAKANLRFISETARRVPWEAPSTFKEGLCTLALLRKAFGSLEGVGPNTFGRPDKDLFPLYEKDIAEGRLTKEEAYDLISKFLLLWDCHYDHDMKMVNYADHELENTYTIGGCDDEGKPLYNDLTKMFLAATREENIIFPKVTCRFSAESPKEYLDEANRAVVAGTSSILYQNDDATIPAIVRSGRPIEEARELQITGCWGLASTGTEKYDHGNYVNLMKPFEFGLHRRFDKMEKVGIEFLTFDDAKDFEDFYGRLVENCKRLIVERINITKKGAHVWHKVTVLPIFTASLEGGIERKADYTKVRAKYKDDYLTIFGLPNIVDSLMAIKTLVFDKKAVTLEEYLGAVRNNWEGAEDLRIAATRCSGWGDGKEESTALANRFNNDLYDICSSLEGTYGGKVHLGHLTYTEIRWWGEKTLATPDGRRSGDYFAQGLTPSRLKKIDSSTDVIASLSGLDSSTMAGNNVVNIILPADKIDLDICEAFLRGVAASSIMCLQLNCVTKEQLLDAQKHPENYPNLIVRVCGFSARFTALSPEWQQEVLTRNFYNS